jgi:hypothetical protein
MLTLREWQKSPKDKRNYIIQASTTDGHDTLQTFPIGMSYHYLFHNNYRKETQIGSHDKLVLFAIAEHTDLYSKNNNRKTTREKIISVLSANGIPNIHIEPNEYFVSLPSYKFVVSPEGNGIDTHRTYESLMAGCIPIVEHNPYIEKLYEGCPILYTYDYSEITPEYLDQKYSEMFDKLYDFSKLFLSSYQPETREYIKYCSNFWSAYKTGKSLYRKWGVFM